MATGKLGSSGFSNYANTSTGSADKFSASVASGLPVGSGFGGGGFCNTYSSSNTVSGLILEIATGYIVSQNGGFISTNGTDMVTASNFMPNFLLMGV